MLNVVGAYVPFLLYSPVHSSGEVAMKSLMKGIGFAANPMLERIHRLSSDIDVSFIYGKRSWNDYKSGELAKEILGAHRVSVDVMEKANHHVYGFPGFNALVNNRIRVVDLSTAV